MLYALFIINKAGGLIYNMDFSSVNTSAAAQSESPPRLSSNEYLVLAGTFHGVHAITAKLSPLKGQSSGLETLDSDTFQLRCFQTLTGLKFILLADPSHPQVEVTLGRIYDAYADYVMKNPFYTLEMPIRCELFDSSLTKLFLQ